MSRILFLIHGMGAHDAGWASSVRDKLNEAASRYRAFSGGPAFDRQVELVPVSYDTVFDSLLQRWGRSAGEVEEFAASNGIRIPDLGWLAGASDTERNFFWSHLVDILLYRYFPQIATQVRLQVMTRIAETMVRARENASEPAEFSVMAHSMGTAVAHDSLAQLGTYPLDGSRAFLAENGPQFLNLFMIANVSRILETNPPVYDGIIHPASVQPDTAYCHRYFNFRHDLDPFIFIRRFNPANWGRDYRDVGMDHIGDFDLHSYEHYLDAPQVHIPIINGIFGPMIPKEERDAAIAEYAAQPGPPCVEEVERFIQQARRLVALVQGSDDIRQLIVAGAQFLALAKEARDACS